MKDIWNVLEEQTRTWNALERQGLADAIWSDYVSIKFGHTGNPHALEYLYPYLNHADKRVRLKAIEVAAHVFEGRGRKAVEELDYFTKNPDLFIRDRAVQVVGAALNGLQDRFILEELNPYLNHRNQFIRKLAMFALGKASAGKASPKVLAEIRRIARDVKTNKDEVNRVIATAFAGRPTEEVYSIIAESAISDLKVECSSISILVRGSSYEWYERACKEIFEPRLHAQDVIGWRTQFIQRDGISSLCNASPGFGMEPLNRMLHLRNQRCTVHAILFSAPECFAGADPGTNYAPLIELIQSGDVQTQRIASVCLGRMMMGAEDEKTINVLIELCNAKNQAVQSSALTGLGMPARSTCNEELRKLCLNRASDYETAVSAIRALGMIFLGSANSDVFRDIQSKADVYRSRPVKGKKHCKPLNACYWATGLIYLGTGSIELVEFLMDVLALPRVTRTLQYQSSAAKALVMIEFPEARLGWKFISGRGID
jgi:hypothetical protein